METDLSGVEHIGARLRDVRLEEHLTQEQVAELSGTKPVFIQKIENGYSHRPRPIMLLAEALKVNPAWLQFGEPYAQKKRPGAISADELEAAPKSELAAWPTLAVGEPYAQKKRPDAISPDELEADPEAELTDWLTLAERFIRKSKKAYLAETARLLALTLAQYQHRYGELPLEDIEKLSQTKNVDDDTAQLAKSGMETLIRTLRRVTKQEG